MIECLEVKYGEKIRHLLKEKDIKQAELARRLDISPTQVSQWLSGYRRPSRDKIAQLARALNVPLEELYGEEEMGTSLIRESGADYICDLIRSHNNKVMNNLIAAIFRIMDEGDYRKMAAVQSLIASMDPKKED